MRALGDFIGGRFVSPLGEVLTSRNPARAGEVVFETAWDPSRVDEACAAAAEAEGAWRALSMDERWAFLVRFREAIAARTDSLSEAITLEMGKLRSEARIEVKALLGRFVLNFGVAAGALAAP